MKKYIKLAYMTALILGAMVAPIAAQGKGKKTTSSADLNAGDSVALARKSELGERIDQMKRRAEERKAAENADDKAVLKLAGYIMQKWDAQIGAANGDEESADMLNKITEIEEENGGTFEQIYRQWTR